MNGTDEHAWSADDTAPRRWAPWWLYLLVLLPANYLRAALLPADDMATAVTAGIALGQAAVLFAVVTVIWRATHTRQ